MGKFATLVVGLAALAGSIPAVQAAEILSLDRLDLVTAGATRVELLEARLDRLERRITVLQDRRQELLDNGKEVGARLEARLQLLADRIERLRERIETSGGSVETRAFVLENGVLREVDTPPGQNGATVTTSSNVNFTASGGAVMMRSR